MNAAGNSLLKKPWPVVPLGSIVKQVSVGIPMSRYAAKDGEEAVCVPVLSVGNIEDERISCADLIPQAKLRIGDFKRFRVNEGDVLVSARGTILKVALVLHSSAGVFASSNIIIIRPDQSRILPQVILALLRAPKWQEILKIRTRSSTGLMQLTAKDVASLPIPVPPIKIQEKIALLVEQDERAYRSAIDAANRRRALVKALLSSALSGPAKNANKGSHG